MASNNNNNNNNNKYNNINFIKVSFLIAGHMCLTNWGDKSNGIHTNQIKSNVGFWRGKSLSTQGNTSKNFVANQQTQSIHDSMPGSRTHTTLVEGQCFHQCGYHMITFFVALQFQKYGS